jgi:hypothetical protein
MSIIASLIPWSVTQSFNPLIQQILIQTILLNIIQQLVVGRMAQQRVD